MEVLILWLNGWADMIAITLNEFFSWNICGLNVGALVIIVFVLWLAIKLIWG